MPRLLIVDDDRWSQSFYNEELAKEGYEVAACGNASLLMDTIDWVKPDVVVLASHLEERNQWNLVEAIRYQYEWLPVVLNATALNSHEASTDAADADVPASSGLSELKFKLRTILDRKSSVSWERNQPILLPPYNSPFESV